MTTVSPINSKIIKPVNTVKTPNNNSGNNTSYDGVYQDLVAKANEIKPNKAKATLVRENPIQGLVSSVKDFVQDGKNFFKAVQTGKMDDNNLGRINDFGMKIGGLAIATFLASMAKTKTSAIMQYIGGAAFFSSMALWPKLFINLPARLVHGFRIDQKYISAQGEKKDFFLDNQFLPWDAFSEEELRENASRAGISYDSENGDEKIKRKMQKTALQNRTLWMATAGFATPLMTALFGDFVEPKVKKAVINSGLKKSKAAMENFDATMSKAKPVVRNANEIDNIIAQYKSGVIGYDEMISSLSKNLTIDLRDMFNDADEVKAVANLKFSVSPEALKTVRANKSIITNSNAEELIRNAITGSVSTAETSAASTIKSLLPSAEIISNSESLFDKATADSIIDEFKSSGARTYASLSDIVLKYAKQKGINPVTVKQKLGEINFRYDDTAFFDTITEFNKDFLGQTRGRLKEYLKTILNPVIGMKDESVYTDMYRQAMDKSISKEQRPRLFDFKKKNIQLPFNINEKIKNLLASLRNTKSDTQALNEKEMIEKLFVKKDKSISELITAATSDSSLGKISEIADGQNKDSFSILAGDLGKWISSNIKGFTNIANINIDSIRAKALIAANLDRRIKSGDFKTSLETAGLISAEFPYEEWVKKAKYLVEKGTVAADACKLEFKNESLFNSLRDILYNPEKYSTEKEAFRCVFGKRPGEEAFNEIENILGHLKSLGITPVDNAYVSGLKNLQETVLTEMRNNMAWKRIFVPMSMALVAVTLLAQPFFGNIKNEFPDEKKGGKN